MREGRRQADRIAFQLWEMEREVLRGRLEARNILNTSFVSFSDIEVGAGNAVPIDLIETCEREFSHERI